MRTYVVKTTKPPDCPRLLRGPLHDSRCETFASHETIAAEPIAIVGIGCRFPGADSPAALWRLLCSGMESVGEVPRSRRDLVDGSASRLGRRAKSCMLRGGFLDRIDEFDAEFFAITPREAAAMDPQQRLLLECAWEAIEDAGLLPARLAGTRTGVFIGQVASHYWDLRCRASNNPDLQAATGSAIRAVLSGRLSYWFDLRGPSLTVDSACSSSLVAVHLACQSLRSGESTMAVAGAANIILVPQESIAYANAGMLSPQGRCRFGDAGADGFVRSEGVAVVVLKPLQDAMADRDPIYAVIQGTAISNDGQAGGFLTTPAVAGQTQMLTAALADVNLAPEQVDYVEAHGTGTSVGDPVELEALGRVYGAGRDADRPLLVGSIKSNIGHTEAAAGIAGLVKAALSLKNGVVPPTLHVHEPNPSVAWDNLCIRLVRELVTSTDATWPRVAGVSSFGISGTNAHVLLGQPPPESVATELDPSSPRILPLSARSADALQDLAKSYLDVLNSEDGNRSQRLRDICFTASVRRTHHEHRLAVTGANGAKLATGLRLFLERQVSGSLAGDAVTPRDVPRIAFVFPGQGCQWVGMGRELLRSSPAFRTAMEQCDCAIRAETGWSVMSRLRDGRPIEETDVVQPAIWATEVSLAALWQSWGVRPDVLIGQSLGEVAAAHVAGALSLEDAAAVICRRSRLARDAGGQGTMAAVELSAIQLEPYLVDYTDKVAVAVETGPRASVLSGARDSVLDIKKMLDDDGVFCSLVNVEFASHSPQMDPLVGPLVECLADIAPGPTTVDMCSTVFNRRVEGADLDAVYWARNLREPVRFAAAIQSAIDEGPCVFLEVSPHPILVPAMAEALHRRAVAGGTALPTLRREESEFGCVLETAAELYTRGVPLQWETIVSGNARCTELPRYPWRRERHWIQEAELTSSKPGGDHILRSSITEDSAPPGSAAEIREIALAGTGDAYLADHVVGGLRVLPGTVVLEAALRIGSEVIQGRAVCQDVQYHEPAILHADNETPLQLRVLRETGDACRFEALMKGTDRAGDANDGWIVLASGRLSSSTTRMNGTGGGDPVAAVQARCPMLLSGPDFYDHLTAQGYELGECFRAVCAVWAGARESLARLRCPQSLALNSEFLFHPAFLEACAQPALAPLLLDGQSGFFVVQQVGEAELFRTPGLELWSHSQLNPCEGDHGAWSADVRIVDYQGRLVAQLRSAILRRIHGWPATQDRAETIEYNATLPVTPRCRDLSGNAANPTLHATGTEPLINAGAKKLGYADEGQVLDFVIGSVGNIAGIAPDRIDHRRSLRSVGLDSLMTSELRRRIDHEIGVALSATSLLRASSLSDIASSVFSHLASAG